MKKEDLPNKIPVFPLSNFIIFPKTTVPLNIFELRYIDMINDSMKSNKLIGMIQPKTSIIKQIKPELHEVGCLGKITSFRETEDGRFLIEVKGLNGFPFHKPSLFTITVPLVDLVYGLNVFNDIFKFLLLDKCFDLFLR